MVLKKNYIGKKIPVVRYDLNGEIAIQIKAGFNTLNICENRVDIFLLGQYQCSYDIPVSLTIKGDKRETAVSVMELPLVEKKLDFIPELPTPETVRSKQNTMFDKDLLFRELRNYKIMNVG